MWVWSVFGPLKCGGDSVYLPAELPLGAAALGLTASQRLPGSLQLLLQEHHLLLWGHLHSESLGAADNLPLDTRRNVIIVTHWDNVSAFPTAFLSLAILNFHLEIFSYKYQLLAILIGKDWCQSSKSTLLSPSSCWGWFWVVSVGDSAADLLSLKQLSVKFLLVDQPPPAAQSLQLTEHSSQPPVLQLQLMDFFFLIKHVEQTDVYQNDHRGFDWCLNSCSVCLTVPLLVWGWVRRCLWCSRTSSWVL